MALAIVREYWGIAPADFGTRNALLGHLTSRINMSLFGRCACAGELSNSWIDTRSDIALALGRIEVRHEQVHTV